MHPCRHAATVPDKPAIVIAETGDAISYRDLDERSNRVAHFLRSRGLAPGDRVAYFCENTPDFFALTWGAQRAGLVYVCISTKLTAPEVDYIVADSGAKLLVVSASLASAATALTTDIERYSLDGPIDGFVPIEPLLAAMPATPIADERAGVDMLYSSGTTGRPKGVRVALPDDTAIDTPNLLVMIANGFFGLGSDSIYLCPAPLYHAAPLRWSMTVHRLGGTVVLMRHFDAEAALATIERYRCNAGQFVPTHFVRMLKLPAKTRAAHDVSSLKVAIHAAAPCPIPVKRAMIDWWGPVIFEYYAGSEGNGLTAITSAEWLAHPGSVGRILGETKLHICNDAGDEVPPRIEGLVFFESTTHFEYHRDPVQTAKGRNAQGWTTLGDVGWVDEEGWLWLTDRKSFMIISGGVNIYPQEIENLLVTHSKIADVAVIGAPHDEMGEQVVAVVQPVDMRYANDDLAAELTAFCRKSLSRVKIPRRIDFVEQLPRHDTGKLYKRLLRDAYWAKETT